jgi:hypothetical protein
MKRSVNKMSQRWKIKIQPGLPPWLAAPARAQLVTAHRVAVHIERYLLGSPKVLFGFIRLQLPTLLV